MNNLRNILAGLGIALICGSALAQSQFGQSPGARSAFKPNRSMDRTVLRAFPSRYIYVNPSSAADAPPGRQIEFFVSPFGSDNLQTSGLTPGDAFKTVQFCYDMVISRYYYDRIQPFCRITNPSNGGTTTYVGPVEVSGPSVTGAQNQGGTNISFWGTCALDGSPWNGAVGAVSATGSDTILQSGGPLATTTVFSLVNGAIAQATCLTVSADVFAFYVQQFSNLILNSGIRTILGPGGSTTAVLATDNHGQLYASGLTILGNAATFATASNFGQIVFFSGAPGSIIFSGTRTFTNLLTVSGLGGMTLGSGATTFTTTGTVTATNSCSVTLNGVLITAGTSAGLVTLAGGPCAAATGGQIN